MMTKDQAQAIAALVHALRPEWDEPGIFAALSRCHTIDGYDAAMAALRAAANRDAATPGVIPRMDGEHWRERIAPRAALYPPRRDQACKRHPGEWPDTCRGCAGDRLAGDRTTPAAEATNASEWATRIRGTLRGGDA
jgi:hypothetical protein